MGLARKFNCELQIPSNWIGYDIFDIPENVYSLSGSPEWQTPVDHLITEEDAVHYEIIDLLGYWQFQSALDLYSIKDVLEWLPIQDRWLDQLDPKWPKAYLCSHERYGDYVYKTNVYCCVKTPCFHNFC